MTLTEVIKAASKRVEEYADVVIERCIGTVTIAGTGGDDIFLQGDEADQFIATVDGLYADAGDVTIDEAARCHAEQYCENIWS